MTATALKPQGLPPRRLAMLAARFARGGIDYIKDDHGLADQAYSPFAARVEAVAAALTDEAGPLRAEPLRRSRRHAPADRGRPYRRDRHRRSGADDRRPLQLPSAGARASRSRLPRPSSMAGAARIAPPLLLGKLFRMLLGADALVFPTMAAASATRPTPAGRWRAARSRRDGLLPSVPVPAGGMTIDRVGEMLDFYGAEVMLLIGGALLEARDRLLEATAAFVAAVGGGIGTDDQAGSAAMASRPSTARRRATAGRRRRRAYKEDDRAVRGRSPVRCCSRSIWPELRYFEMSPGGFSTPSVTSTCTRCWFCADAAIAWSAAMRSSRLRPAIW